MVRVKIELVSAVTGKTSTLGEIKIANDGVFTRETGGRRGRYHAALSKRGGKKLWKVVTVDDFPRQSRNVYDLIYRVLQQAVSHRNPKQ